ncbi:MAG: hypothetical protein LBG48_00915 [Rickettsiales bacterium]|jgi:aspartyl aminopeptidase|nr:hypothetical protein [Rickettsiales bacterium]
MTRSKRRLKNKSDNVLGEIYIELDALRKEYSMAFNKCQDLAIENYELKKEMEKEKEKIKNHKSINNTLKKLLDIAENDIVKKDLKIKLLELNHEKYKKDNKNN